MLSRIAGYNHACVATMTIMHISMFLNNFELQVEDHIRSAMPVTLDSFSAAALGEFFKDKTTKIKTCNGSILSEIALKQSILLQTPGQ
jgi:hypothetical protein